MTRGLVHLLMLVGSSWPAPIEAIRLGWPGAEAEGGWQAGPEPWSNSGGTPGGVDDFHITLLL